MRAPLRARSYHWVTATSTGATSNFRRRRRVFRGSRCGQIRGERIDDVICGSSRTRALTGGDIVHENGKVEWMTAVEGEVSRQGGDLVERAGLGADPPARRATVPSPGQRS